MGWPGGGKADRIEVFLEADKFDTESLMNELKRKLPTYMVPREIRLLERFPLNRNGKYDRRSLEKILAEN